MLTIHSFGRVVRRHEREALLHQNATRDDIASARRSNRSTLQFAAHRRLRAENDEMEDPFSDAQSTQWLDNSQQSRRRSVASITGSNTSAPGIDGDLQTVQVIPPTSPSYSNSPTSDHGTPTVSDHQCLDGSFSQSCHLISRAPSTSEDQ